MLPYQTVAAMDYGTSTTAFQRHQSVPGSNNGGTGLTTSPLTAAGLGAQVNMNINPAAAAFTHSWFVPADFCGLPAYKHNQNHHHGSVPVLEPGILELRKEKSRDAARSRRGKENFEFYELAKMLPLPAAITSQLDKASIIRLTISYLKLRDFSGHGDPPWNRDQPPNKTVKGIQSRSRAANMALEMFEQHQGTHILQSLDGFALALAADGRFLYISETVSIYLGLSQVEMTGSSIFDYVHHADHTEMAEQLGLGLSQGQNMASPNSANSEEGTSTTGTNNPDVATIMSLNNNGPYKGLDRAFCIRMKSTLTKRGCHFKSSGYRVVLLLCRLRPQYTFSHSRKNQPPLLGMVALAIALPPPSVHEIRLESDMFVTRINFDFRIAHCEPRVSELLDYTAEELTGKNLYALCHGEDANKLRKCHLDLISKGQVLTHYYRMMNKNGGYTWVQTCATVVCNSKNADEQNIICVNYIISGLEYENLIMDCCQLEDNSQTVKHEETSGNDPENRSPDADRGEGHSGGAPNSHQDSHRSPANMDDGSSDGPNENKGRHMDNVTQLQMEQPIPVRNISLQSTKDRHHHTTAHKRKLSQVDPHEPSGSEEDNIEDDIDGAKRKNIHRTTSRSTALSPASSSCHSNTQTPATQESHNRNDKINLVNPEQLTSEQQQTNEGASGTSVKDLEHAMSKHLPSSILTKNSSNSKSPNNAGVVLHQPTDFSTDALLKQQQQRSTIQWIGAHHHLNHLSHHQQLQHAQAQASGAPLPATALLRQLYANRESVIRANVHSSSVGSRTTGNSWSDVSQVGVGPLPTPPGSEGSSSAYVEHQFMLSQQKANPAVSGDAFTSLISTYSSAGGSGGGGGYGMDYHSAMTPPSSVSPRDKHQQLHTQVFDNPVYSDVLRAHQYGVSVGASDNQPAQPLPLKPQVYSAMHPSALDTYGPIDQSQFYHHGSSAAGFHLYHPATAASSKPSSGHVSTSNWYSTSS
ncbi:protein trachealess isoform X2 [Chrysoperla carnea]|uniref:protein trachealess isoform X2 n=1 Tax=Chrysoperla carnea TaxID=189513 RepID=UPI001D097AB8|nr:protein trachealess isoform X2 [Chrysoperla carnea]